MDLSRKSKTILNPEDQTWMGPGRHGEDTAQPGLLDAASALAKYPTGIVPSGVEISRVISTGRFQLGISGLGTTADQCSFLLKTVQVDTVSQAHVGIARFWHGVVVKAKVPLPSGISAPTQANHPNILLV